MPQVLPIAQRTASEPLPGVDEANFSVPELLSGGNPSGANLCCNKEWNIVTLVSKDTDIDLKTQRLLHPAAPVHAPVKTLR